MPSIYTPPALQIVDQLSTLSSKLLAASISLAQSTCFLLQRDACRDVVLGQGTPLDSLSLVMMGLPAVNDHPQALVVVRGHSHAHQNTVVFSSAVSKS